MKIEDPALFRQECYIDGNWVNSEKRIEVSNPADSSVIGSVPALGTTETRAAIEAAQRAYLPWRNLTAKERSGYLKKWFDLIVSHKKDLAIIMTSEQGKPIAEAEGEILYGAAYVEWFAEEAKRVYGNTIPMAQKDKRIVVLKEPVGVCAAITPWNFPSAMITRKAAPALAAGCTVVVKPAAQTPFSALALAELAHRAGIPPGVFNVLTGPAQEIGAELTANPIVRKLSFTGSTPVGKQLMAACSDTVKKISLELGGHAPFIVFDDADIDAAVAGAMASKYRNAGQTCVCANRFIVQEGVYEAFAEKLAAAVESQLHTGSGFQTDTNQGPLIDLNAVLKVEEQIRDACEKGARIVVGGKRSGNTGFFFEPTILLDVTSDMKIAREETFGPVAPLFVFQKEEDAVAMANDSQYGLASYFYSRDMARCWRITEALEYGMVGVNTGVLSSESAPFGGMKESGIGREGSMYGIDEYLEIKYMCVGGLS
ncbi:MAG: NAD-dependent succinate-semialdehyde dehydrogenase [Proteobacteria bacterium]|nr:NAD-dependent succinate-semialdehyde dehydrogenase [Pseudomonadota bacterium]MBU1234639.1 NAD-dependent succinate-semialdehyde dehydrogenase [Pseudomonadota bacterium]MBU1418712.1 NAD-dependent succinate-semialdehyde dehydrogenase [Pseudomonadota bacterium]MBU1454458.1 NAD-dependent succinate-semialdehyde dehydrogenase [Pseudomonadota bacterium]